MSHNGVCRCGDIISPRGSDVRHRGNKGFFFLGFTQLPPNHIGGQYGSTRRIDPQNNGFDVLILSGFSDFLKKEVGTDGVVHISANDLTVRSEEHTSELQSRPHLVCRLLLEKKKN